MNKTDAARLMVNLLAEFVRSEGEELAERLAEALKALLAPDEDPALEDEAEPVQKITRRR
jgi:hypothetical protein